MAGERERFLDALCRTDDVTRRAIEDYIGAIEREVAAITADIRESMAILEERLPPRQRPRPSLSVVEREDES